MSDKITEGLELGVDDFAAALEWLGKQPMVGRLFRTGPREVQIAGLVFDEVELGCLVTMGSEERREVLQRKLAASAATA